jgi:RimJ/RimL family protein N-acetyltransferase
LRLRKLTLDDAQFILRLLNEPSFIQNIGDKRVRTLEDARNYILSGPIASYEARGFGLCLAETKTSATPVGICGLLKRDQLADVDIGYALVPEFWSKGYALEAAAAVVSFARKALGLRRLAALTFPHNAGSIRVLEKLGFRFERMIVLSPGEHESKLFTLSLTDGASE